MDIFWFYRPVTEARLDCAAEEQMFSREIRMSCNNSEDLQRKSQLFPSNTNQRCLLD